MRLQLLFGFLVLTMMMSGQNLRVAAAADLAPCSRELQQKFEAANPGVTVSFSIGSSVQLAQQIDAGAPFDVFLSADIEQPERLIASGKAVKTTLFTYAEGELIILVPASNPHRVHSLQDLASSGVTRIAMADPSHAPYGKAAQAALRSARLYDRVKPRLVIGENVAQSAQFVLTGNADAGLVSATAHSAFASETLAIEVNHTLYPPIRQGGVQTAFGAKNPAASRFLAFLRTPAAKAVLRSHGLKP
ncbi:MAG: molybdate ABC transporter substrate-binding protein [Acidobacteriaceae bacterium]